MDRAARAGGNGAGHAGGHARPGFGIWDGNGIMFISHTGQICPAGFLPLIAGSVRRGHPVEIYRKSRLFNALRNPDGFTGKRGRCEYRKVCGGSRARAFAATGDPLESAPLCTYQPVGRFPMAIVRN